MLPLEADVLLDQLHRSGCDDILLLGDHARTPYDRTASNDLIVIARKTS